MERNQRPVAPMIGVRSCRLATSPCRGAVGTAALAFVLMLSEPPALAADGNRGMLLYENHCLTCHDRLPPRPEQPEVDDLSELRQIVTGWALHARLPWTKEDIEDVVCYLNRRYYTFPDGDRPSC